MNAPTTIGLPVCSAKPVGQAINWRGKCIGHYARVEWSVARLLFLLCEKSGGAKLPPLSGAKSAALRKLLNEQPQYDQFKPCLEKLETWGELEREREWIAHGHFDFAHNEKLGWVLIAQMLVLANGRFRPTSPSIPASDLGEFEKRLATSARELCSELDQLALAIAGSEQKLRHALYNASSRAP